jgi:hypothetical protein
MSTSSYQSDKIIIYIISLVYVQLPQLGSSHHNAIIIQTQYILVSEARQYSSSQKRYSTWQSTTIRSVDFLLI